MFQIFLFLPDRYQLPGDGEELEMVSGGYQKILFFFGEIGTSVA